MEVALLPLPTSPAGVHRPVLWRLGLEAFSRRATLIHPGTIVVSR